MNARLLPGTQVLADRRMRGHAAGDGVVRHFKWLFHDPQAASRRRHPPGARPGNTQHTLPARRLPALPAAAWQPLDGAALLLSWHMHLPTSRVHSALHVLLRVACRSGFRCGLSVLHSSCAEAQPPQSHSSMPRPGLWLPDCPELLHLFRSHAVGGWAEGTCMHAPRRSSHGRKGRRSRGRKQRGRLAYHPTPSARWPSTRSPFFVLRCAAAAPASAQGAPVSCSWLWLPPHHCCPDAQPQRPCLCLQCAYRRRA